MVDGEVLELSDAGVRRIEERLPSGRIFLERDAAFAVVDGSVVRDRRALGEFGIVLVALLVDRTTREPVRNPEVRGRGAAGLAGREAEVAGEVSRAILELPPGSRDDAALAREASQAVRRWFRREGGRRPAVQVVVLEI
jgi:mRNA degradation ribonuclease J1/J2